MFRAALIALTLAHPIAAAADGSIALTLSPRNVREAQALQLVLDLYALHRGIDGAATVRQHGGGNGAALRQSVSGTWALIDQRGQGHQADVAQTAPGALALFQSGRNTSARIRQQGGVGITFLHGW